MGRSREGNGGIASEGTKKVGIDEILIWRKRSSQAEKTERRDRHLSGPWEKLDETKIVRRENNSEQTSKKRRAYHQCHEKKKMNPPGGPSGGTDAENPSMREDG